ncbi:ABC transporter ATP-binding protein [Pseudomonas sp. F1_0610]|uniref:ABC transporter ATP-binding protein n=1 Tax=Pseudomonas sp. F1_0610 TaxID=3114284 RepID=UPI0039C26761
MSWFKWFEHRINPYPQEILEFPKLTIFHFVRVCAKGAGPWLLLLIILNAGLGVFEAVLFQLMGIIVDWMSQFSAAQLWQEKRWSLIGMLLLIASSPLWVLLASNVRFQTLQGVLPMRLRWQFHRMMLGQSMQFYQDEFAGRVSAKVMQTALAVRDTIMICAEMLVYVVIYFLTTGLILLSFDAWLLLPFAAWLVIFGFCMKLYIPKLAVLAERQADARALMTGRITDAYSNIATVKLFSHGGRESRYAKRAMHEFLGTVKAQMRWISYIEVINHSLNMLLVAATAGLSLYLWSQGQVNVGAVAAATAMALRLVGLSHWIMWESTQLFENLGTVQDGMNTLSKPNLLKDHEQAKPLQVNKGEIEFKQVDFRYVEHKPLLTDFNLHIKAGEKIGLVGRSGAGKSTLVNILLRFYDVNAGQVLIDGQDISQVTQQSLRQNIGMVTQDTSLLHRSVRDNIVYGRPTATEAEVQKAIERAQAAEFIPALTDAQGRTGLDAHVGDRGIKLSGGQRQRIAIARVMLKDAPILLLDEATSALDSEVEVAIQESLYDLMENKTVIAIAHRLSTIAAMDRLVVLDKGQIVEMGTHQELLAKNGLYARLWNRQSGGFLGDDES